MPSITISRTGITAFLTLEGWNPVVDVFRRPIGVDSVDQGPFLVRNHTSDCAANVVDVLLKVESLQEAQIHYVERHVQLEGVFSSADVPRSPFVLAQLEVVLDAVDRLRPDRFPGESTDLFNPEIDLISVAEVFVHPHRLQ